MINRILIQIVVVIFFSYCNSFPAERGGSYLQTFHWHYYQKYLPEKLKYDEKTIPVETYWDWRGNKIHLDVYARKDANCKVILVHGGGGNGRLLMPMAKLVLQNSNCEIIAPDFPGYGLTVTNDDPITYDLWVNLLSDLIEKERKVNQKIYLFGLSIGGMLSYHAAAKNKNLDGLIVTTLADVREKESRDAVAANLFLSRIGIPLNEWFHWITDPIFVPIKWLSKMQYITNDPKFSSEFENDPYAGGGKVSFRFLRTFMNYNPELEPEKFDVCKILLIHPGLDPWTPFKISKTFYDKLKAPKKLVILEGAGHFPYEEPGLSMAGNSLKEFFGK